jgi:hypothetical protein
LDDAETCWKALEDVGRLVLGRGVVRFGGTGRWVVASLWFWFCFGLSITGILSASVYVCIWGMCGWAQTIGSIGEAGGGFLFVVVFVWVP